MGTSSSLLIGFKYTLDGIESITDRTLSYSSCLKPGKVNRNQYSKKGDEYEW
jgi:hypothetical protein